MSVRRRTLLFVPVAMLALLALCGFSGCGADGLDTTRQPAEPTTAASCPEHGWALLCPDRQDQPEVRVDPQVKARHSRHEAAHAEVAEALGATVVSCRLNPDGSGKTRARGRVLDDPVHRIAYELAGVVAVGTDEGAEDDLAEVDRTLSGVAPDDRDRIRAAGRAEAGRIVTERSAQIDRDAAILLDRGRL